MTHARKEVALESTLLCHGVPREQAIDVATSLERAVRAQGAEPKTVAVIDGEVRVGLDDVALRDLLARPNVEKVGARGIPGAIARGVTAATTVSATMAIAAASGIEVFATGGIGGVHRGASSSFDESEDLTALAHYPVAVVSAGAKAILDLPKTVERLETLGVPVVGFGTDRFTQFYTNDSSVAVQERVDSEEALARLVALRLEGRYGRGGALVVNRVPCAVDPGAEVVAVAVERALQSAEAEGARGAAATPAALAVLNAMDEGRFLRINIALAEANASLAGRLAVALAGLER